MHVDLRTIVRHDRYLDGFTGSRLGISSFQRQIPDPPVPRILQLVPPVPADQPFSLLKLKPFTGSREYYFVDSI